MVRIYVRASRYSVLPVGGLLPAIVAEVQMQRLRWSGVQCAAITETADPVADAETVCAAFKSMQVQS